MDPRLTEAEHYQADEFVSSRKWFGIIAGLGCFVIALIIATTQP